MLNVKKIRVERRISFADSKWGKKSETSEIMNSRPSKIHSRHASEKITNSVDASDFHSRSFLAKPKLEEMEEQAVQAALNENTEFEQQEPKGTSPTIDGFEKCIRNLRKQVNWA